jgi:hypothetical protein
MILESLDLDAGELARRAGWEIKPQGACKGDLCVPLQGATGARELADRLGMPVVRDERNGVWAVGPATVAGGARDSAEAPDLVLPDHRGEPFALRSLRGQRVLLLAWASW